MIRTGNEAFAPNPHFVLHRPILPPFPENTRTVLFGMGCFWGAERRFWQLDGIWTTAVGYAGGHQPDPDYRQVCTGRTGHAEVVLVVYDDTPDMLARVLRTFWESHDPTQGMRQGNDVGTQYRSAVYVYDEVQAEAVAGTREAYQATLRKAGYGDITTEARADVEFWYAEDYHQQYLAKNPAGYCGLGGTGCRLPAAS